MLTSDFHFNLPEDRIAQDPAPRGTSRLLVVDSGEARRHLRISDLPSILRPGDLLVIDNTKVIPARLFAKRESTGGRLEILLVDKKSETGWEALVRPAKRAKKGERFAIDNQVTVEVVEILSEGRVEIAFSQPIDPHLDRLGHIPLPPYIRRPDRESDRSTYQTVYARRKGAIAAPTAGLHFDKLLLARLEEAGVGIAELTLHVGVGTFKPVTSERIFEHKMDSERFDLPEATVAAIHETRRTGGRVIAVGTTVVRTLESVALDHDGRLTAANGSTDLFITPGFRFSIVDLMVTNFHLPRSTLLMLVCAFAGKDRIIAAYRDAVERNYRFYSYGDAMLLSRV